ncbi:MAG: glycosyltransferase [Candidatus Paceibacterota bacterium]|jgi:glycosyltransferase involved in cell wall biosynthesis/putative flippase GtrA
MKVISLGMGQKIFEKDSAVRQRQIEYGKFFDELHMVVFTPDDAKFQNEKIADNVFLYPTKSKIRVFYIFDFIKIVKKILKKIGKENVVLTCQDPFETGIAGAFIKLFFDLPLHVQIHTDLAHKYFIEESFLNKVRFFMSEFTLKYSDRVRVVSERIKKSVWQFSKNIDVLPIKTEISQGSALETKKPFPFTLIMVCRLEKEKNIKTVFDAIKNLDKNIGLCLVGDGSQKSYLENMAKNIGISERVFWAGWQNNLSSYYKMADSFISTSFYEGYGVSTVEAALDGLPLLLSDTGLAEEMFKNNESALVCGAKDVDCFSKNISKIYEDKELGLKLGQRAKSVAEEHLNSLDNYYEKYADSVVKTANSYQKKGFVARIFGFVKISFNSVMLLRYFICGVTSAGINILSLYIFTDTFGIWYLYSSIISFFISLIISFVLQKFVVFKDTETNEMRYQFSKFFIAAILGVITNTLLISLCVEILGIWYILAQLIAGFFVMIQNFVFYKFFIFNRKQ